MTLTRRSIMFSVGALFLSAIGAVAASGLSAKPAVSDCCCSTACACCEGCNGGDCTCDNCKCCCCCDGSKTTE